MLFPEDLGGLVHLLRHIHTEWTACHATAAVGALRGMMLQGIVLRLQLRGHSVALCLVQQLVHLGDGNTLRTGRAMVAIGAVASLVGLDRLHHGGIVLRMQCTAQG